MRTEEVEKYFGNLERSVQGALEVAKKARKLGFDPELEPEIPLTRDFAERVERLLGLPGLAEEIRQLERDRSREELALTVAARMASRDLELDEQAVAERALRVALAIITEAVPGAAVLEGITKVEVRRNPNGTRYLSLHFASPIRAAGGTAAALTILVGDVIRRKLHLDRFLPSEEEIERYVEEAELYAELEHLQFTPSPEDIRLAVRNLPVEVTGEPTNKEAVVTAHRNLPRVGHNFVRGGAILALVEGVLQKAPKLLKYVEKLELDGWDWLHKVAEKLQVAERDQTEEGEEEEGEEEEGEEEEGEERYLKEVIGGRPVFCHPHARGGFRLRYGRARNTGYATVGMHPATMYILEEFPAVGTQLKTEFPGKAATVAPVDSIEGPTLKLKNGSVVRVNSVEQARALKGEVEEILFLGDLLVSFGEFLENNHPLLPPAWCEEWWAKEVRSILAPQELGKIEPYLNPPFPPPPPELAVELSEKHGIPLHPFYTYDFEAVTGKQLCELADWLETGVPSYEAGVLKSLRVKMGEPKRVLELLGVPHSVEDGEVVLTDHALVLAKCLSLFQKEKRAPLSFLPPLEGLQKIAGFPIRRRAPTVVGARMGRPEKASPRKMKPPPHVLFPVSTAGGSTRNLVKAASKLEETKGELLVEVVRLVCPNCGEVTIRKRCEKCGAETEYVRIFPCCKREAKGERCPSHGERASYFDRRSIPLKDLLQQAAERLGEKLPEEIKGVKGLTSASKFPEPLEKGILRAKHGVFVFKDGTVRYDLTNMPLTHFRPREVGVSVERLRELGYETDWEGEPLEREDQLLELRVQDVIISKECADYLVKASRFVDELLEKLYGLQPFYRCKTREDLVGHLLLAIAPHTSVGVVARIVGFTDASVCFASPFFHAAKRRDCDGDQDAVMLLLDGLLNFSRRFLPEKRGGTMDAPLMLITRIDPLEVDKEAHHVEVSSELPLEFYQKAVEGSAPAEVLGLVEVMESRLKTERKYEFGFNHDTSDISGGPPLSKYKLLESMEEKTKSQLELAERIRAVDERDVAERLVEHHFIRDIKGNLRTFASQKFRCVSCNQKYRRVPLAGSCVRCGGNLILTMTRGGIEKYLKMAREIAEKYQISEYLRQRLKLVEGEIESLFEGGPSKQLSLADFLA
ncbi:MAG: DNA polymerase II large subunit [Candidatus Hadarchaeales archaeon]